MVDVNIVLLIFLKCFIVGGIICYVELVYIIYIIFIKSLVYKGYFVICGWILYK